MIGLFRGLCLAKSPENPAWSKVSCETESIVCS